MKTILATAVLLDFKSNLIQYWDYVYGVLIFAAAGFMIYWGMDIMTVMKEDAKKGRGQMMTWGITAVFVFGIVILLEDILGIMGVNVNIGQ